jgi:hypothetical protein
MRHGPSADRGSGRTADLTSSPPLPTTFGAGPFSPAESGPARIREGDGGAVADYPRRILARLPLARQAGAVVLGVVLVLFVLWLVLLAPRLLVPTASEADLRDVPAEVRWQARDNRLKLQNDIRTTLLQGLGGLAVLVGAFFTYRQLRICA